MFFISLFRVFVSKFAELNIAKDGDDDFEVLGHFLFWLFEFLIFVFLIFILFEDSAFSATVYGLEMTFDHKMVGTSEAELPGYHYCLTFRGNDTIVGFNIYTQCFNRYNVMIASSAEHVYIGRAYVFKPIAGDAVDGSGAVIPVAGSGVAGEDASSGSSSSSSGLLSDFTSRLNRRY